MVEGLYGLLREHCSNIAVVSQFLPKFASMSVKTSFTLHFRPEYLSFFGWHHPLRQHFVTQLCFLFFVIPFHLRSVVAHWRHSSSARWKDSLFSFRVYSWLTACSHCAFVVGEQWLQYYSLYTAVHTSGVRYQAWRNSWHTFDCHIFIHTHNV